MFTLYNPSFTDHTSPGTTSYVNQKQTHVRKFLVTRRWRNHTQSAELVYNLGTICLNLPGYVHVIECVDLYGCGWWKFWCTFSAGYVIYNLAADGPYPHPPAPSAGIHTHQHRRKPFPENRICEICGASFSLDVLTSIYTSERHDPSNPRHPRFRYCLGPCFPHLSP